MNAKRLLTSVLFFFVLLMLLRAFSATPTQPSAVASGQPLILTTTSNEYVKETEVLVHAKNNTASTLTIESRCPKAPLDVLTWTGTAFVPREASTTVPCERIKPVVLAPQEEKPVSLNFWNHSLFGDVGRYKVAYSVTTGTSTAVIETPEFTVTEAGSLRSFFRAAFTRPLYNLLVFLISIAPSYDLGFAIIFLTLIIRVILLVPSQKAIVSQRRLQELQPHLDKIKKEYAGNQERIAHETMQLWKQHKVNPFGSCLPLIIQFPILIALFYVIQSGLNPDNAFLLYGPLKHVELAKLHTLFLGILDLTIPNRYVLPLIVGVLQYLQLKLTNAKRASEKKSDAPPSEMETANKSMTYIMPIMIAVFTASVPAGVGLYWGVSTLFAIGQQLVANRNIKI